MYVNKYRPRLNPRRARNAERLHDFLHFRGGKLYLTPRVMKEITSSQAMHHWEINAAIDDLYAIGAIVNRTVGDMEVIETVAHQGVV